MKMKARYLVSVIISTYNQRDLLTRTLDSLLEQTVDTRNFEVIVVDDGSNDGTNMLVRKYDSLLNIKYHYQEDLGFRVALARNAGAKLAEADIILLLDSGMVASERLLKMHIDWHGLEKNLTIIGLSYGVNEYDDWNFDILSACTMRNDSKYCFEMVSKFQELKDCRYDTLRELNFNLEGTLFPWVVFWSGHVSFRKHIFFQINGFDEQFLSWGGEDVDLGIRLHRAGCKFMCSKEMETIHLPHPKNSCAKKRSSQQNIEYICTKYEDAGVQFLQSFGWKEILTRNMRMDID